MEEISSVGLRREALALIRELEGFWPRAEAHLGAVAPDGTLFWHVEAALIALACVAGGLVAAHLMRRWGQRQFAALFNPEPADRAEKIAYLLSRAALQLAAVAALALVAFVLAAILGGDAPAFETTLLAVLGVAVQVEIARVLLANLLAPDTPSHRLTAMSDADARLVFRALLGAVALTILVVEASYWVLDIGLGRAPFVVCMIVAITVAAAMLTGAAIATRGAHRRAILRGRDPAAIPLPGRLLTRYLHILVALYFGGAWVLAARNLILGGSFPMGPIVMPVMLLIGATVIYGMLLLVIDKVAARYGSGALEMVDPDTPAAPRRGLKDVAELGARILVGLGAVVLLLEAWNVTGAVGTNPLLDAVDIVAIVLLGYLALEAVRIAIDRKIAEEGVFDAPEPGEEGGSAASASRLGTLLPLFRNVMLITVGVMVIMIALSQMGVDIAPLFAGAGVVGLAVGFGAQTLIRDIFSGAFFLMDDAFRKGEYIDLGGIRGNVEKISLRSMQLRHHLGALHTVPFGEIKQLTNYSRDWAMMKLSLRLTYDTDVEKVRKLIKTLGKDLAADPEIGPKFVQPLKSQGVYAMEDSAMIVRVKYMTKPGDQFVIRKRVYQEIRDMFEREGIRFAHREVTVRVAEEPGDTPEDAQRKKAIAGAALPAIEDQMREAAEAGGAAEAR